jgi:hypothetical protein
MTISTYEITYVCPNEDWISSRVEAEDYQAAVEWALARLCAPGEASSAVPAYARLLRIERLPEGYAGLPGPVAYVPVVNLPFEHRIVLRQLINLCGAAPIINAIRKMAGE